MKEIGIIMSGNHPKLILDRIKTQTRRVITPQPKEWQINQDIIGLAWKGQNLGSLSRDHRGSIAENYLKTLCPYGQVGDRLGVKETHWRYGRWKRNGFTKTGKQAWKFKTTTDECLFFDDEPRKLYPNFSRQHLANLKYSDWFKRPSIFLPKKYIRIWLEITEVRVERVQEIDYFGARAEGILSFYPDRPDPENGGYGYNRGATGLPMRYDSTAAFMDLWDSLNAKRGYGWEVNPWVWVITFKVVK